MVMDALPAATGEIAAGPGAAIALPQATGDKQTDAAGPGLSHGEAEGPGHSQGKTGGVAGATETPAGTGGGEGEASFRKRYLARLLAHIEAHKFYPPTVRRRRLEGGVLVQFILGADGRINNLRVSNGEPLLEQAARQSVERAVPMPLPQQEGITPLSVSYTMKFQLR